MIKCWHDCQRNPTQQGSANGDAKPQKAACGGLAPGNAYIKGWEAKLIQMLLDPLTNDGAARYERSYNIALRASRTSQPPRTRPNDALGIGFGD
jgi:hypothetical protein